MEKNPNLVLERTEAVKESRPNEINEESLEKHARPRDHYTQMSQQYAQHLLTQSFIK
jgi:hypothetical protein